MDSNSRFVRLVKVISSILFKILATVICLCVILACFKEILSGKPADWEMTIFIVAIVSCALLLILMLINNDNKLKLQNDFLELTQTSNVLYVLSCAPAGFLLEANYSQKGGFGAVITLTTGILLFYNVKIWLTKHKVAFKHYLWVKGLTWSLVLISFVVLAWDSCEPGVYLLAFVLYWFLRRLAERNFLKSMKKG